METKRNVIYFRGKPCVLAKIHKIQTEDKHNSVWSYKDRRLNYNVANFNDESDTVYHHLYFTVDEKPEIGDACVVNNSGIRNYDGAEFTSQRKIVAATDTTLRTKEGVKNFELLDDSNSEYPKDSPKSWYIPQPSQAFVEKYCEIDGIDAVLIELNETSECVNWFTESCQDVCRGCESEIKINSSHNTVNIYPVKDVKKLFKDVKNPFKLHHGEIVDGSYPDDFKEYHQFKKFDGHSFYNYIDAFSDKDIRIAFSIMLKKMQEQVIGYIEVYPGYFEPAISEHETYMPLSSFGLSNTHINANFIQFPDGKRLSDMVADPNEYMEWCKANNINK